MAKPGDPIRVKILRLANKAARRISWSVALTADNSGYVSCKTQGALAQAQANAHAAAMEAHWNSGSNLPKRREGYYATRDACLEAAAIWLALAESYERKAQSVHAQIAGPQTKGEDS